MDSDLRWRLVSAAVGIPALLLAVFGGLPWVSAVVLVAAGAGAVEIARLSGAAVPRRWLIGLPVLGLAAAGVAVAGSGGDEATGTAAGVMAGVVAAIAVASAVTAPGAGQRTAVLAAWAAVYFGALLAHAPGLAAREDGSDWLLIALLGTFAVDSAAYFTGRAVGRRKLAPRISPKKTWEGAIGGLVAGPAAVLALNAVVGPGVAAWQAAALGLAVAVGGTLGDLAESALKRATGVKDSGAVIPGHGGILDRIDSLAPDLAIVYWAAVWMGA